MFGTNCVVGIIKYWSWNHLHRQWMGTQIKKLNIKCISESISKRGFIKCFRCWPDFCMKQNAPQEDLPNKMYHGQHILTESWLVVCPIDTVCYWMFWHHRSEPYFFNWWIIYHTEHTRGLNTVGPGQSEATGETTQFLFFFLSFFLGFRRPNLMTGQWLSGWQLPIIFLPSFLFVFLSFCLGFRRPNLFLSFFLGFKFRRPNLITGLSGWQTPN